MTTVPNANCPTKGADGLSKKPHKAPTPPPSVPPHPHLVGCLFSSLVPEIQHSNYNKGNHQHLNNSEYWSPGSLEDSSDRNLDLIVHCFTPYDSRRTELLKCTPPKRDQRTVEFAMTATRETQGKHTKRNTEQQPQGLLRITVGTS